MGEPWPSSDPASTGPGQPYARVSTLRTKLRQVRTVTAVLVIVGCIAAWYAISAAIFDSTSNVPSNSFDTSGCFQPRLQELQTGEETLTVAGDTDVTLSPIDPTRTFVLATMSADDSDAAQQTAGVRLVNGTTLRLTLVDADGPVLVRWTAVTYECGVSVQHGAIAGGSQTATITAVDPSRTVLFHHATPTSGSLAVGASELHSLRLTDPTTVTVSGTNAGGLTFQAVEFAEGSAAVQTATADLTGLATTDVTLASAVDPGRTLVLVAANISTTASAASGLVRADLIDSTTVRLYRGTAGAETVDVAVQVVELYDGTIVERGTLSFGAGQGESTVSLDAADPTRTVLVGTGQSFAGQGGGSSDETGTDRTGEGTFVAEVQSGSSARFRRSSSAAAAELTWQAVTWSGLTWWDTDWAFRRRLTVAATVDAEQAYSVQLTFDHAALVADGTSLANGDDIRIVRWDGTAWTELDRVLAEGSAWGSSTTTVWFRTTDDVPAGGSSTYWLFHANQAATNPPEDPTQVFLISEGFEGATLGAFTDGNPSDWYAADPWTRRRLITVSAAVASSDQSEVVVPVQLTDGDLAAHAQADGSDLRFVAADGTSPLAHEIERYDSATGALTAWVRLPLLSSSVDTTFYLVYGSGNAPDQSDADAVWADHTAVWHLDRDPAGDAPQLDDAGPDNLEGLSQGSMASEDRVSAIAGEGVEFDGVDDRLVAGAPTLEGSGLTVTAWVRPSASPTAAAAVSWSDVGSDPVVDLGYTSSGPTLTPRARVDVGGSEVQVSGGSLTLGVWAHLAVTHDGATVRLYVDGVEVDSQAAAGQVTTGSVATAGLGGASDGSLPFPGVIDEVRISSLALPADRLEALEATQRDPSSVQTVGAVETGTWFGVGDWSHRMAVSLDGDLVTEATTDRALPLTLTDPELTARAATDGADLVVTAADGLTRLDHTLVSFDSGAGTAVLWVRVPQLQPGIDTGLFLYFGNPTAVDQQDPTGTFGASAAMALLLDAPVG